MKTCKKKKTQKNPQTSTCFVTSHYVQNQFPPPKQDVHNTLSRPRLKGAKTPSTFQYVKTSQSPLKSPKRLQTQPPTGHCVLLAE